jgi:V/A-type H+-transporting ATPase subunit F
MSDIAFIGDRDSVWGFAAFGMAVRAVADGDEARAAFDEIVAEGPSIVFVTEDVYDACAEQIARYRDQPLPTVTVLPGVTGSRGVAAAEIQEAVSAAVGADILGDATGNSG